MSEPVVLSPPRRAKRRERYGGGEITLAEPYTDAQIQGALERCHHNTNATRSPEDTAIIEELARWSFCWTRKAGETTWRLTGDRFGCNRPRGERYSRLLEDADKHNPYKHLEI